MSKPEYIDSLKNVARERYLLKLSHVDDIDPYQLDATKWTTDNRNLPKIDQVEIHEYLVHRVSFYTRDTFKAQKQLSAHNQLTSGWIKRLQYHQPPACENVIIMAEVLHSQSLSEKPLKPWVIAKQDGTVLNGHCDCMAGIAESCTHVAALLFTVDATVRLRDSLTPTQLPASWGIPSNKPVMYREANEIDFTSASTKKKQLESVISGVANGTGRTKRKIIDVSPTTPNELERLFETIQYSKSGVKPALLSLMPKYVEDYVVKDNLPCFLFNLFDSNLSNKNYAELLGVFDDKLEEISVTSEQVKLAESLTRNQSKSKLWTQLRVGRITASSAFQVCHTNINQPSISLINQICKSGSPNMSQAMKWGRDHECDALNSYHMIQHKYHTNFELKPCGLFINPLSPTLAATPDSIVICSCHGYGCVEVKCPWSKSNVTIKEACKDSNFCLEERDNEILLKKSHSYYYQVQLQILITDAQYSDFVVWTTVDTVIVRIYPDSEFMNYMIPKLDHFFKTAIFPELVAHFFSGQENRLPQSKGSPGKFCYCKRTEDEDNMVACDNPDCGVEWFHFFCVGVKCAPKGRWLCPECRQLPQFRKILKI